MQKHKFNIFPEMQAEDFGRLKQDLSANGYDAKNPIWLYGGEILDGWNRQQACADLSIVPVYKDFLGGDQEAIEFVMRTNKRRNLNSSQWACIATEADEMIAAIRESVEKERRERQAETQRKLDEQKKMDDTEIKAEFKDVKPEKNLVVEIDRKITIPIQQLIVAQPRKNTNVTDAKIATTFNTNRTYISEAQRLKRDNPVMFEKVKAGEKTITEAKKEEKSVKLSEKKAEYVESAKAEIKIMPEVIMMDCTDFLNGFDDDSIDLLFTDPPYSTDVDDILAFTEKWLNIAIQKTKKSGRLLVCSGAYPIEINAFLNVLLSQDKFIVDNPLIWTYKNTLGITPKNKYNLNYQLVWHLYSRESGELDTSITNEMFSVMEINAPDGRIGNRLHTWQKPDELALRLIRHTSKVGDLVVDPFCCTGTFLLAANRLQRISKGCDNNQDNLNIAISRGCTTNGVKI